MVVPMLQPYVVSVTPYDVTTPGPGLHRGLPSTTLTVVLAVDEPLDVTWSHDSDTTRQRGWSSVAGLHTSHARVHHNGHQAGVQLALTPAGSRALLGLPAAALHGELLQLPDLAGEIHPRLVSLPDELATVHGATERTTLVSQRLVEVLAAKDHSLPRAEIGHALARLTLGVPVQAVADETGLSRRHLGALLRAECGVGPKQYQRLARFAATRRAWSQVLLANHGTLADVAARCGYTDQAHLTREWNVFAGCTPTVWAREEFPFVQDPPVVGP